MSQLRRGYLENAANAQNNGIFVYSDHSKWIKSSLPPKRGGSKTTKAEENREILCSLCSRFHRTDRGTRGRLFRLPSPIVAEEARGQERMAGFSTDGETAVDGTTHLLRYGRTSFAACSRIHNSLPSRCCPTCHTAHTSRYARRRHRRYKSTDR